MKRRERVVLISGVSSGIGHETASRLASAGYKVFGTSRQTDRCVEIEGVQALGLDLHDPSSVNSCVARVLDQADRIDVLINNAGYALFGGIEESSETEVSAQFDTNYFGLVRLTKAVLPVMRERKQGHIINISSIAGLMAVPFMGHYSASKFAIEGYTEALYHEVIALGIRVSLIAPGVVRSPFWGRGLARTQQQIGDYERQRNGLQDSIAERVERLSIMPEAVARKILMVMEARRPALHYPVGPDAALASYFKHFLPARVLHAIWHRQMVRRNAAVSSLDQT